MAVGEGDVQIQWALAKSGLCCWPKELAANHILTIIRTANDRWFPFCILVLNADAKLVYRLDHCTGILPG